MRMLPLRAAITRGVLLVFANWPVVLIDFAIESLFKLAVSIPILGASLGIASLMGTDMDAVLAQEVRSTADLVLASLATAPLALTTFLVAVAIVAIGGEAVMFVVKAGTLAVLVKADGIDDAVNDWPLVPAAVRQARVFSLQAVLAGARRFGRRAVRLALWLGLVYAVIGAAYVAIITAGFSAAASGLIPAWPIVIVVATTIGIVVMTLINLAYDLLRVVLVTDDCDLGTAAVRLQRFVVEDLRQVLGIFGVMSGVQLLATTASLLAAAGLALVAYVPFVSVVFLPLQAAAWVLRGATFQSMGLSALAACQTQYRRFSRGRWPLDGTGAVQGVGGEGGVAPVG